MHLDLARSSAQQLLALEGERFVEERMLLRRLLRPGMTVVDVGANIGYYLLLFQQQVGPKGRVICIEPSTENLPELRRNIEGNRFGNVVLHEVALGKDEGKIGLRSGVNSGVVELAQAEHVVQIRRLDNLVTERVDLLKIDVEGYEGQVLSGADALIERDRPIIFLELHPQIVGRFGFSVRGILADLGRYYPNIRLYERAETDGRFLTKLAVRYFGRDGLVEIKDKDKEAYLDKHDLNPAASTCWAVCEPAR